MTASTEVRAERVAHAQGLLAGDARKQIEHADQQRRAYLRSFHDVQQELPTHYDLVVNTDHLPVSAAVDVIVAAAHPAPAPQPAMALVQSR